MNDPIDELEIVKRAQTAIETLFGVKPYHRVPRPEYEYSRLYYTDRIENRPGLYFVVTASCDYVGGIVHVNIRLNRVNLYSFGIMIAKDKCVSLSDAIYVHQSIGEIAGASDTAMRDSGSRELVTNEAETVALLDVDPRYKLKIG